LIDLDGNKFEHWYYELIQMYKNVLGANMLVYKRVLKFIMIFSYQAIIEKTYTLPYSFSEKAPGFNQEMKGKQK